PKLQKKGGPDNDKSGNGGKSSLNAIGDSNGLLVYDGNFGPIGGQVMVDSGATRNFLSDRFLDLLPVSKLDKAVEVNLPDGRKIYAEYEMTEMEISIDGYSTKLRNVLVVPLFEIDLILGLEWLATAHPEINFEMREIKVKSDDNTFTLK